MLNKQKTKKICKATVKSLIVAFVYAALFLVIIKCCFSKQISDVSSLVNLISMETSEKILEDVKLNLESKNLESYPDYGTKYATLIIPSLNVDLPVYFGDALSILKKGVGHSSGSYFPGEGGSILYMGHNTSSQLSSLKNIKKDAIITVKTSYGTFNYKVYETKVINYKNLDAVPIQRDEEILMVYTCYQSLTIGHTQKRFMTYAKLVSAESN